MARILLVDDDVSVLNMLGAAARGAGHEIVGKASSPQDAEQQLAVLEGTVDVVILDGKMPNDGDGAALAQKIRLLLSGVKIISFAGQEEEFGDIEIQKPDVKALLEAINRLC